MRDLFLFLILLVLLGCASIRDHRILSQPENQELTASVGSTLFRLTKKSDLPNVFGARDIYGGKVDRGYAEARLAAVRQGRYVDLIVSDVSRESTETVLDRYGERRSINVSQTVNFGRGGDSGMAVTVDTESENTYVLAGVKVTFKRVRNSSVVYSVEDIGD